MRNRSIVWIPVLLVGAMVYWTLALGFGGRSLMFLTSDDAPCGGLAPRNSYQPITVNVSDTAEQQAAPEAVLDAEAQSGGVRVDLVPESDLARYARPDEQHGAGLAGGSMRTGPGDTAY